MSAQTIGFVGLGAMGGAMAGHLVKNGYAVTGYDISAERAEAAARAGVTRAASPAEAARSADVVMSSLPHPAAVRAAYLGPDGVLSRVRAGAVLVDLSTIDPDTWKEVARVAATKGLDCLDAPVSGGPVEAGSGKLVFIVGGDERVLERCRPIFTTLGTEIHHVGPLGSAQVVKIVNNVMSMGNVAIAAEAMVLGVKAGMDPQRLFDILSTSGGRSHHFLKRFPNVLAGDFDPRFSIALSRKDLGLAARMAESLGVPMLTMSIVRQVYEAAGASGLDGQDMAAVTELFERWAGVQVRGKPPATR
ncbi:MAG TPA: NAD(P)-dependent oxidoreductase [Candidatus Acidoferrum sp.]|jgi:3-hydroxyisobutyrate dehydrogenase|nr:NAD(P)-dependent oxidoreductase [Candidatus Acidoferrum sp.]